MQIFIILALVLAISCKKESEPKEKELDPAFVSIPKNPLGDNPEKDIKFIREAGPEDAEKIKQIMFQNIPEEEAQKQVQHLVDTYGLYNVMLWISAPVGDLSSATQAIENGADVNIEIAGKGTPILGAVESGNIELTRLLLKHEADPNRRGPTGSTPLSSAVSLERYDLVDLLIEKGANFTRGGDSVNKEYSILTVPLSTGNLKMAEHLLKKGANANGGNGLPLAFAIMTKNIKAIDLLIKHGADVNFNGKKGFRPLMTAVVEGDEKIIKSLLGHGADPKLKDENGKDAYDWAKKYKSKGGDILKKLTSEKN